MCPAPPSKRGRVVGAQQWAITWGILISEFSHPCFGSPPLTFHSVLHQLRQQLCRWTISLQNTLGTSNVARCWPVHRSILPSGISKVRRSSEKALRRQTDVLRWLARKDRWEDCHNVLALVHAKGNREAPFVMQELQEIKDMCEFERRNADVSYLELFKPHMINRTHIGVFTQIWSQLTGMNVMMYCKHTVVGLNLASMDTDRFQISFMSSAWQV